MKTLRRYRLSIAVFLIALQTMWQVVPVAHGATVTWNAGSGTNFNWADVLNWDLGAAPLAGDDAIFGRPVPNPGTLANPSVIVLGAGSVANRLDLKDAYTLTGGDLTLTSGGVRVDMGVVARVDSILAGSAGLTKTGGGSLRLTGANTYTGITTISNGSLIIGNAAALGADTSTIIVNGSPTRGTSGGALVLEGGYSSGVTLSRDLSLSGYGPIADRSAALNSVGTNTLTGLVSMAVGTSLPNTRVVSNSGLLTFAGGLDVAGTAGTTVSILGGAVNAAGAGGYAITGVVTGTGTLEKNGAGTLLLNPSSMSGFSGQLRMSSSATGTQSSVRLTAPIVLGTRTSTGTGGVIDMNGGILEVMMDAPSVQSGATPAAANVYQRNNSTFYVDHGLGSTVTGGTLTLGQWAFEENFNATFNVRNGYNVTIGAAPVQGGNANSTFTNNLAGGTLTFTGAFWSNSDSTGSRTLTVAGSGNTTITGNVTAANGTTGIDHSLTKTGTGTLQITSTGATLDGNLNVNGGTVQITDFRSVNMHSASTTSGVINIGTGGTAGTLTIGTATAATGAGLTLAAAKAINLAGTTGGATINANQAGANPVIIGTIGATGAGAKTLTLGGTSTADNRITGAIANNSGTNTTALAKTGPGTWLLSGVNTYTGSTTISNGTLKLTANAAASTVVDNASAIIFNANTAAGTAGGTLQFTGFTGAATTESLGALTPTAGAGSIILAGSGAAANLTFASLGATTAASSINFITTGAAGGVVRLTGQGATTATSLPGTANFQGHLYINGADFAAINASTQVITPVYGTTTGFVNAAAALTASNHNLLTGSFATPGDVTVSSLKLTTQTLALGGNLTLSTGGLLQTGGSGFIDGSGLILGGAAATNIAIRVNGGSDVLTLRPNINVGSAQTGGLTKNGAGTLILEGTNAQTGTTTVNEGTIRLSGATSRISATSAALVLRQGTLLEFDGTPDANAVVANLDGAGTITNINAAPVTMTIAGTGSAFTGVIQDGAGVINLTKGGTTGTATLTGLNTYTGVTTIAGSTGLISTPNIANIGVASGIGRGNTGANAASLVFSATGTGGLNYTGTLPASTDRLFTLNSGTAGGGGQIANSSGTNAPLTFTNTGAIAFGPGATVEQTITFGGASTADNVFAPQITNNGALATAVTKIGAGTWVLTNPANNYTGITTIGTGTTAGGVFQAVDGVGLPAASPLLLGGGTTGGGIFQSSGNFTRNVIDIPVAGTGTVTLGALTSTTAAVGFSASGDKLVVALGGLSTPTPLTWGSGGFMGATGTSTAAFVLNNALATSEVEVRNAIDLNGAARTIQVDDNTNTGADFATITGVVSGSGSLTKSGTGILQLFGANTYTGNTAVTAGTLTVTSLGNSASPGATSVGDSTGGNIATGSVNLGNGTTGGGVLEYVGPGETTDRMIRMNVTTGSNQIHANGSGALIITNLDNSMTAGARTLLLRGNSTAGNTITSILADNGGALGVTVDGGAMWILSGANTHTGNTTVSAGALGLGDDGAVGSGTLVLSNGNIFASGGDRTIANSVTLSNNTTPAFVGDYSFTFTGAFNNAASANNTAITNNIVAGKSLTIPSLANTAMTAARTLTLNGSGETNIIGDITTSTGFNLNLTYSGTGMLVLNGGNSDLNGGAITLSSGTLKLGATEVIPHGIGGTSTATAAVSVTAATITIPVASTAGLVVGQTISGTGVAAGTQIASIVDGTTITASVPGATTPATNIASGAALSFEVRGNMTINPAAGASATFDLNGNTETINGLTGTTAGTLTIDNSAVNDAGLTVGGNDQAVQFNGSITRSGGGGLLLGKIGSATGTFAGPASITGINVQGGGLKLTGGLTTASAITSVQVVGGSLLSLQDGVGTPLSGLSTLNLGAGTGTTTLELDAGDLGSDSFTSSTAAIVANAILLNIRDAGLTPGQTYDLLVAPSGLNSGGVSYTLGPIGGYTGSSLVVSDTSIKLTVGAAVLGNMFWTGAGLPGPAGTTQWNTVDGSSNGVNWSTDKAGTTVSTTVPGAGTTVVFQANSATVSPLATTLEQSFRVNNLIIEPATVNPTALTIAPGAVATNRLTVQPAAATDGIELKTGATPLVTISAPFTAGSAQTWTVADAFTLTNANYATASTAISVTSTAGLFVGMPVMGPGIPAGATVASVTDGTNFVLSANTTAAGTNTTLGARSSVVISGGLSGSGAITKAGAGRVAVSGTGTYTGASVTVNAGSLEIGAGTVLGGVIATPDTGAPVTVNGGTFYISNGTSTTVPNNLILAGGTLSAAGNAHTYSGTVTLSADSTVNMLDPNTLNNSRSITLPGVVSGTGQLTVNSITAVSSGNQLNGTLAMNGNNSGWSGGLLMQRGTVTTNNSAGLGTGPVTFNPFGRITLQGTDGATWTFANQITYADGAIGEIGTDNTSTSLLAPFTVNFTSPLNLGAASGARFFLADGVSTAADLPAGVVLNGDASISVGGGAGAVLVVSGVISEVGGARALAVNDDLGGWGTTNRTFRPTAANTFTGNLTLGEGTLEFSTVTDAGGAASNLGRGNAITLGAATLSFIGDLSQSTNRPITTNGSPVLNSNSTSGADITYAGAITQAADNSLTLTGPGTGFITGGISQPAGGATADLTISSGNWTISTGNVTIADDLLITGGVVTLENMVFSLNDDIVVSNPGSILNLNSAGVWAANNPAGTSSFIFSRGGAVVNINASDVNGVNNANQIEGLLAGDSGTTGTGFISLGTSNISIPRLDVGAIVTGFDGNVSSTTGVLTGTSTATDYNTGFRLFRGVVSAKLAGVSTILKQGLGDATLSGDNSGLTGTVAATRLDAGNLILDYTSSNTNKVSAAAALDMRGATITLNGNASAPTTQAVNGFTLANGGANTITMNAGAGQTATLTLAGITRAASAGTLRLNFGSGTFVTTTTPNGTHGLVGSSAFATVKDGTGTWFATRNGSNQIVAMASTVKNDVTTWATGDHVTDDTTGYTGTITGAALINSVRYNAATGTVVNLGSAGILSIGSGGVLVTDQVTADSPSILGGTLTSGVAEIIVTQDSTRTMEISSAINSGNAISKAGNGVLKLSGVNTSVGQVQIMAGTLQAFGGRAIGDTSIVTLADDRVTTLQLLSSETIGRLAGGSATSGLDTLATVAVGGNTLTLNTIGGNVTYAGMLTGAGVIVKEGTSNQAFSNISAGFTGSIVVNNGLFQLTGIGQINASAINVIGAGNFLLDNNGTTRSGARVLDSTPITLNSASGTFSGEVRPRGLAIRTNQAATTSETIGSLNFASGNNWLTGEASGSAGVAAVIADNFTRSNNATVNVRGRALGLTTGDRNQFRIGNATNETAWIAAAGNLVGGGAAPGTTLKNVSIVPWVVGENLTASSVADANMGNTFVTYVAGRGFVPLLTAEYSTYATAASTDNVRESLTADATGLAGITLNSLVIHNDNTAASAINITGSGAGQTLTNTSGAFLFTLNPTAAAPSAHTVNVSGFDGGVAIGTTGEYVMNVINPSAAATTPTLAVTIASPLVTAAHIVKSGRGALILSGTNTAGGGAFRTVINEGVLEISALSNIGGNSGQILLAGGTLRLGSTLTDDISQRSIVFQLGGGTIDTNGITLALAGSVGSGAGSFTKAGAGTLTLNATSTYTGSTNVNGGTLAIGVNNAISSGALNVNGGGTLDLGANSISVGLVTTAGASPVISGAGTITSSAGFILNHTGDTDIPSVLTGNVGLFKAQTNTVTLSGANTFTGPVEVQAGAIAVATFGNVGDLSGPLGAQADAFNAMIRLGSATTTGAITYTGAGETSNRLIGLNGSTGGGVVNANGTGALILSAGAHAINGGAKSLTLSGTASPSINNQMGLVEDYAGGPVTLAKAGTATWELTTVNTYTGGTNVDEGILRPLLNNSLPAATTIRMGSGTTAGTLDLTNSSQTVAGLTSQTNSASVTNSLLIGSGQTLTVNGAVIIGVNAAASTTLFAASGGGAFVNNNDGGTFGVGGATGNTNVNAATADFSGLSSFTVNLGATGTFRVGDANTNASGSPVANSTAILASTTSVITAGTVNLGQGTGQGSSVQTLSLGAGSNAINSDTINIGGNTTRSGGAINFAGAAGSVVMRGVDGTSPVTAINMVNGNISTGFNQTSDFLLAGHDADVSATALTMAARSANTGSVTAVMTFDQGSLNVTTLNMASRTGAGTGDATATLNLGDSAAPGSPTTNIGTVNMAVNTSAGGTVTSNMVITGGTVNIGTGTGNAINMANAAASRTAVSNINLTGGTLSVTGNIIRTGGAGTETATITVNGGSLTMNGNSIGTLAAPITLQAQSGTNTITGLAELNGGGLLTKSTTGALSLGNGNTYTGGTQVTDGTLLATNTTGSATGSGPVTVDATGTLGGNGSIIAGSGNSITVNGTLDAGLPAASSGSALALTVGGAGNLALNGTTLFQLFTNANTGTLNGNTAADQVVVNAPSWSNVVFGASSILNITTGLTATTFVAGDSWKIFDWVGVAASGTAPVQGVNGFNSITAPTLDVGLDWDYSALFSAGTISVIVVPEPSRALLLMLGLFGICVRRRRK